MSDATKRPNQVAIATAAWGLDLPEWVQVLAEHCDRDGQRVTAARIGMSASVVTETLSRKYKGRVDRVAERVKGALMGATVDCPVLGELARDTCMAKQQLPFAATNPERVQLWRACPKCPNYRRAPKAAGQEE